MMDFEKLLMRFFTSSEYEPMTVKQLARHFGLRGDEKKELEAQIDGLVCQELIRVTKRGRIKLPKKTARASKVKKEEPAKKNMAPSTEEMPTDEKAAPLTEEMPTDEKAVPSIEEMPTVEKAAPLTEEMSKDEKTAPTEKMPRTQSEQLGGSPVEPAQETSLCFPNEGVLQGNRRGAALFLPDEKTEPKVYIAPTDMNGAGHGDRVRIRMLRRAREDQLAEGRVERILQRNDETITGLYREREKDGQYYVYPDNRRYPKIWIHPKRNAGAHPGDKVVVVIDGFDAAKFEYPTGHITEIIGSLETAGIDITSVARRFDLPYEFSEEVQRQAAAFPQEIRPEDRRGRRDLRKLFTVTIDGADAKDFDDAISLEQRGRYYNLYVHIADVSHYVIPGSPIDEEACRRGNSVYLLDRVIPMLPEELSNGLCSLNPQVDRLAMTTQITLNEQGHVVDYQFYPSVICSNHRLVYDQVSDYLEKGVAFGEKELLGKLELMKTVYELLARIREERGAIDFDFAETSIRLNEEGIPVSVGREERRVANGIIEEFMILNNEVIGRHFAEKRLPFIYRVHDNPDEERVDRLNMALRAFRYPLVTESTSPAVFRRLLDKAAGTKEERLLNSMILRSMSKAMYRRQPLQHFGLAIEHYSHFTSPIRRYSDLLAHRMVKALLSGKPMDGEMGFNQRLDELCRHLSDTERRAEEAERDVVAMKCAQYMEQFVGQTFSGTVSSLTNFGAFVLLDNSIEGLAHFRDMKDDYYAYDEEHFVARGAQSKREIHYGDRVEVLVIHANVVMREIALKIVRESSETAQREEESDNMADMARIRAHEPRSGHRAQSFGMGGTNTRGAKWASSFRRKQGVRPKNWKGAKTNRKGGLAASDSRKARSYGEGR